jgi:hypothetical protein
MTKATKLIIATIVLGGLGYFLYKKGLFSNTTTTEVAKDVKVDDVVKKVEDIVKEVVDTGKKTAVEPPERVAQPIEEKINIPISQQKIIYPVDDLYPQEGKIVANQIPSYNNPYLYDGLGFRDNTYFDQPVKIDYSTGKYNQDVAFDYLDKDIANVRFNQLLYA